MVYGGKGGHDLFRNGCNDARQGEPYTTVAITPVANASSDA
jgi:hypothetical protein